MMANYDKVRELAKPMPRSLLVPIISVLAALHTISKGRASIPELSDALIECFDSDTMIIYRGRGYGLAEAYDGNVYEENSGCNERADLICELFNSRYWDGGEFATIRASRDEQLDAIDFLMTRSDAVVLAQCLWTRFFNETRDFSGVDFSVNKAEQLIGSPNEGDAEIDPCDFPMELDAANLAFRAVSNGFGDQSATFKNRLVDYLERNFAELKPETMQRIATVANPDKSTGRKKRDKE